MKSNPTIAQSEASRSPDEGPQVALPIPLKPATGGAVPSALRRVVVVLVILLLSSAALFWFVQPSGNTSANATPTPRVLVQTVQARLYPFPSTQVGLMQPAVDAQGNVWVGEMGANRLVRLDGRTGAITTWEPPDAKFGIMTTRIDARGNVWFVEQNANYLGRFDPTTATFRTYPLGLAHGKRLGPQDLQFDATGKLWFTAFMGSELGRLDPITGNVQTWPVPDPAPGVSGAPFALALTPNGQVWFGDLPGGAVGHLDPATGQIKLYRLADPEAEVFSMTSDLAGRLWFTELDSGKLGMIDPAVNRISEFSIPARLGPPRGLYTISRASQGDLWFVDNGANALVRYTPGRATFTFYPLSVPACTPYALALDAAGGVWFTAAGGDTSFIGRFTSSLV